MMPEVVVGVRWLALEAGRRLVVGQWCAHDFPRFTSAGAGETENGGVIDKTIHRSDGHGLIGEEFFPLFEARVGGQDDGALAMALGDETEEVICLLGVEGRVSKFIDDQ